MKLDKLTKIKSSFHTVEISDLNVIVELMLHACLYSYTVTIKLLPTVTQLQNN